jgi:CRP-like cAMP-binding protein
MTMITTTTLAEELRTVPVFADLPPDDLDWLASQMTRVDLAPGEILIREGSPADRMMILLEGEMRMRVESGNEATTRLARRPVTGMLPYSRMTHFPATIRAVTQARLATLPAERFPEMLARMPVLGPRLVGVLSDRIRDFTKLQDQQEKMAALGKISAGLAHELNNPAAAARRAVLQPARSVSDLSRSRCPPGCARALGRTAGGRARPGARVRGTPGVPAPMDSLERSDCEEAIAACLLRHGVARAWEMAPALVDAGCEAAWFDRVYEQFPPRRGPISWHASPLRSPSAACSIKSKTPPAASRNWSAPLKSTPTWTRVPTRKSTSTRVSKARC